MPEKKKKQSKNNGREVEGYISELPLLDCNTDILKSVEDGYEFDPPAGWKPPLRNLPKTLKGKNDKVIVVNGRRGTGKSFMIRYLLYHKRMDIKTWFVFTSTKFNKFYEEECGICNGRIFDGVNVGVLEEILIIQQERRALCEKGVIKEEDLPIGLIFDDIGSEVMKMRFNDDMDKLFYNGRHVKCFVIIAEQYFKFIGPGPRKNTDYPLIFRPASQSEGCSIIEDYFGFFNKKIGLRCINEYTHPVILHDDDGNMVLDKEENPVVVPVALSTDSAKVALCSHQAETMFCCYAMDPPPFLTSSHEEYLELGEDMDKAFEKACKAYEKRTSGIHIKGGKKPNFESIKQSLYE